MEKDERYYRGYLSHRYVSRRGLFRAFLNASHQRDPLPDSAQPRAPLPPDALPAPQFYQQCDRCQQCVSACPMGVLIVNEEGYPQLAIEYASCDGCQTCIAHCPLGACRRHTLIPDYVRQSVLPASVSNAIAAVVLMPVRVRRFPSVNVGCLTWTARVVMAVESA